MKNKFFILVGGISAIIGVVLIGNYVWQVVTGRFIGTLKQLFYLF